MQIEFKTKRAVQQFESAQRWLRKINFDLAQRINGNEAIIVRNKVVDKLSRFSLEARNAEKDTVNRYNLPLNYYSNTKSIYYEKINPKSDIEAAVIKSLIAADRTITSIILADVDQYPEEFWQEDSLCLGNDILHRWHERTRIVIDKARKLSRPLFVD